MICPTCKGTGQVSEICTLGELVDAMKSKGVQGGCDVYLGGSGEYWITHGGGNSRNVRYSVIQEGVRREILEPSYPDDPTCQCWSLKELHSDRMMRYHPRYRERLKEAGLLK